MEFSEFLEWKIFYETEPFGGVRSDVQMATLAAVIINTAANRKKGSPAVKPSKFIPDWWKDGSKPQAMMAKFRASSGKPVADKPKKANGTRVRNTGSSVSR